MPNANETAAKQTIIVTIDEWNKLREDSAFLNCLQNAGVDNWDGYEYAQDAYAEWSEGYD